MKRLLQKLAEKVIRKGFWIFPQQAKEIKEEARKNWGNNESALMRHIISNWFEN